MGQVTVRARLRNPGQRMQVRDDQGNCVLLVDDRVPAPRIPVRGLLWAGSVSVAAAGLAVCLLGTDVVAGVGLVPAQAGEATRPRLPEPLQGQPAARAEQTAAPAGEAQPPQRTRSAVLTHRRPAQRHIPGEDPARPLLGAPPVVGREVQRVRDTVDQVTELVVSKAPRHAKPGPPDHAVANGRDKAKHAAPKP